VCWCANIRAPFDRFVPGLGPKWEGGLVRYNHPEDLEAYLEQYGHEVAGFLVEPIQGEAG